MAKLKRRYGKDALDRVVVALREMRQQNADGNWVLTDRGGHLDSDDVDSILLSIIEFGRGIESIDRRRLLSRGVFSAIGSQDLTADSLLEAINTEERQLRRIRPAPYVFATHMSLDAMFLPIRKTKWNEALLTFTTRLPVTFSYGEVERTIKNLNLDRPPHNWAAVRVATKGRTAEEAAYKAFESLNEIRAIWNLSRNRNVLHSRSSPVDIPVNVFRLGPLQTIHYPSGEMASRSFWFQQPYVAVQYPGTPELADSRQWEAIRRFEKDARIQLRKLCYREAYLGLLREYTEILDHPSVDNGYFRLWAILEKLTACNDRTGKADHGQVIERTSFVYKDRDIARLLLEHLKDVRNDYVHDLTSHDEGSTCFYQLLRFVHELLLFHLRWAGEFASFEEAGQFLQLSKDVPTLLKQIKMREHALRFMGRSPRRKK